MDKLGESAVRSALFHLSKPPKNRQFIIGHTHVSLLIVSAWFQCIGSFQPRLTARRSP